MAGRIVNWIRSKDNPPTIEHAARTAVAAVVSLLVARALRMPEAYWAPISTLIVMQSSLGAALPISAQRFAGTALGAGVGGLVAMYRPGNALAFALAVFAIGVLCAWVRVERAAYRYAGITLAIVMLVVRNQSSWRIAAHRFIEVSVGIALGLVVTAAWPERRMGVKPAIRAGGRN